MSLIVAHRGGKGESFENSISSFERAIRLKVDSIEVDLRKTKDGEIVILHDESLDRTTHAKGNLSDYSSHEIKNIKLKNGEALPFLSDLLSMAKNKILLHLEVKEAGFEEKLIQLITQYQMQDQVFIISFYVDVLTQCYRLNPNIKTGFLFLTFPRFARTPKSCSLVLPESKLIDEENLKKFKENGRQVHTWVVNDQEEGKRLTSLGVNGLITDFPEKISCWKS